ncbi:MAG: hypothetical protein Q9174_003390 [Haloplaca sp. 1 TL-2023]
MVSARTVIEGWEYRPLKSHPEAAATPSDAITPSTDFRIEMNQLEWQGQPDMTGLKASLAIHKGDSVIVGWCLCRDNTWRRQNPQAFHERAENLNEVLSSNLKALDIRVLRSVDYLGPSSTVTGYVYKMPSDINPRQKPTSLYRLFSPSRNLGVLDLATCLQIAKGLVLNVFEILNLGWVHKSIQPKDIIFWPKPGGNELDYAKPYLIGFNIFSHQPPGLVSQYSDTDWDEEGYRHPLCQANPSRGFLPSYDIYSLGIVLGEIGLNGKRLNSSLMTEKLLENDKKRSVRLDTTANGSQLQQGCDGLLVPGTRCYLASTTRIPDRRRDVASFSVRSADEGCGTNRSLWCVISESGNLGSIFLGVRRIYNNTANTRFMTVSLSEICEERIILTIYVRSAAAKRYPRDQSDCFCLTDK